MKENIQRTAIQSKENSESQMLESSGASFMTPPSQLFASAPIDGIDQSENKNAVVQKKDKPSPVPEITKEAKGSVQIGGKKWIEKSKMDYALDSKEGGGKWIYEKAKSEMGANAFGAALVLAFAAEEGGWGKGNDQKHTHNAFSLLSKKAKSKVGTAHGNVISYESWDEGFEAFKSLIDRRFPDFNELLTKESATGDDINKALRSGSHHKQGGYTDSDKGAGIKGTLKYIIPFLMHGINQDIQKLELILAKQKEELQKSFQNLYFKPFPDFSAYTLPLEIEKTEAQIASLKRDKEGLETAYATMFKEK